MRACKAGAVHVGWVDRDAVGQTARVGGKGRRRRLGRGCRCRRRVGCGRRAWRARWSRTRAWRRSCGRSRWRGRRLRRRERAVIRCNRWTVQVLLTDLHRVALVHPAVAVAHRLRRACVDGGRKVREGVRDDRDWRYICDELVVRLRGADDPDVRARDVELGICDLLERHPFPAQHAVIARRQPVRQPRWPRVHCGPRLGCRSGADRLVEPVGVVEAAGVCGDLNPLLGLLRERTRRGVMCVRSSGGGCQRREHSNVRCMHADRGVERTGQKGLRAPLCPRHTRCRGSSRQGGWLACPIRREPPGRRRRPGWGARL
mmetsp:Transcript_16086/g.41636  ORF Transcript_16086/g.41636 Transcript_16086/m.41636 type:complete len:316 (-) Transcript_16086:287-1234(-)